jgi:hypothetical protein
MASKKEGITATLGTFEIPLQLKTDYKIACTGNKITMTDELTAHITEYVRKYKMKRAVEELESGEGFPCGSTSSQE